MPSGRRRDFRPPPGEVLGCKKYDPTERARRKHRNTPNRRDKAHIDSGGTKSATTEQKGGADLEKTYRRTEIREPLRSRISRDTAVRAGLVRRGSGRRRRRESVVGGERPKAEEQQWAGCGSK
jgi:hypothetical protein